MSARSASLKQHGPERAWRECEIREKAALRGFFMEWSPMENLRRNCDESDSGRRFMGPRPLKFIKYLNEYTGACP
eukprot:7382211-Prymnesium_polylepis.1